MNLYTLGYTGSSHDQIATIAKSVNAIVVDVRMHPVSKEARWNRPQLASALDMRGVGYIWVQSLGNVNHGTSKPIQIANPDEGLAVVGRMLQRRAVILLCACKYPEDCHRSVVADMVVDGMTHANVVHLGPRKPEAVTTTQEELF